MATLAAIQKQIADLEKKAGVIRKTEASAAVVKAKELIARHNLSAEDLGLMARPGNSFAGKSMARRGTAGKKTGGVPKYIDSKTGKTWTGHGKPPHWIVGVKNRDAFLIGAASAPASKAEPNSAPMKKGVVKKAASKKAVTKKAVGKKAIPAADNPAAAQDAVA